MASPRNKHKKLHVLALPESDVREIDEQGLPLRDVRFVGKDSHRNILPEGQIVPYHAHYIAKIKEGSLVPLNLETQELSGSLLLGNLNGR